MSKKILRTITEKVENEIEKFNKDNEIQATYGGIKEGKLKKGDKEAYDKIVDAKDPEKAIEFLELGLTSPTELYFNMPDLKVSDHGSIRSLNVAVYSAEINDNILLHKLFSATRGNS